TASENVHLVQELKESLEQQTATSQILGVIASSPTNIQPVLDVVAENAAKLCDATNAVIMRVVGDGFQRVAQFGDAPEPPGRQPITHGTAIGRAMVRAGVPMHAASAWGRQHPLCRRLAVRA